MYSIQLLLCSVLSTWLSPVQSWAPIRCCTERHVSMMVMVISFIRRVDDWIRSIVDTVLSFNASTTFTFHAHGHRRGEQGGSMEDETTSFAVVMGSDDDDTGR